MRTFILIMTGLALCLLAAFADEAPTQTGPIVVPGQGPNPVPPAENPAPEKPALVARISTDKQEYLEGEPILLTFILENANGQSAESLFLPPSYIAIAAKPAQWELLNKVPPAPLPPPKFPTCVLFPGAYYGLTLDLSQRYLIPPGEHIIKAVYACDLPQEEKIYWTGTVESNEIRIVVKAKPGPPPDPTLADKIKQLIKDLGSEDWETREKASEELIKIGEPAIEPLVAVTKEGADPEVVWRAQIILKELGYTTDETIAEKVQAILNGIKENDWTVKETIGIEIVRLGPRVIGTLKSFLDNPDYRIRQVVVELLGKIPDKQIVQVLINALDDKDKYVTASAAKELRRISGQTFTSFEKDKWQAWWDANKATFHLPELPPEQD
jgi:hypothetical protein